jgi:drug/metabolite transporter (DMT)-like permease
MKHVADVLALLGAVFLVLAGLTISLTVGLAVAGVLSMAAAFLVAKLFPSKVNDGA